MLALGRTSIILVIGLTFVYVCLFFYWRAGVRMRLEEEWQGAEAPGDKESWIDTRLAAKEKQIHRRLILLVYIVPIVAISLFVILTN